MTGRTRPFATEFLSDLDSGTVEVVRAHCSTRDLTVHIITNPEGSGADIPALQADPVCAGSGKRREISRTDSITRELPVQRLARLCAKHTSARGGINQLEVVSVSSQQSYLRSIRIISDLVHKDGIGCRRSLNSCLFKSIVPTTRQEECGNRSKQ